jgi:predicted RNA-binding Zn-ribbon protein involved in translation (DUF1610 family)
MREHGPGPVAGAVYVACPYCHATEALPREHAQRVMALRARLAQLRAARDAEEGPSIAFAKQMQFLKSQLPLYGGFILFMFISTLTGAGSSIRSALAVPDMAIATRIELWQSAFLYPSIGLGLLIGPMVGYLRALARYERAVAPTLRARAPMQSGMPARCRTCGGPLATTATSGLLECPHCGATNLLSEELVRDRVKLLEAEATTYRELAAGVHARADVARLGFTQDFYIGGGVGLGVALTFSLLAILVIRLIFWFRVPALGA